MLTKKDKGKKPFLETGFGQFVQKAARAVPAIAGAAVQFSTNPAGVVGTVADLLDINLATDPGNPELVALKQEFEIKRMGFEREMAEIRLKDRHSAREREIKLRNSIGVITQNVCAFVIITSFVILLFKLIGQETEMPERTSGLVYAMLGSLGTIVVGIFGYWFGAADDKGKADFENNMKEFQNQVRHAA